MREGGQSKDAWAAGIITPSPVLLRMPRARKGIPRRLAPPPAKACSASVSLRPLFAQIRPASLLSQMFATSGRRNLIAPRMCSVIVTSRRNIGSENAAK